MTDIKLLQMKPEHKFTDNYGGVYPNAVVALWDAEIDARTKLTADVSTMKLKESGSIQGLAYCISFWYEKRFVPTGNADLPNPLAKKARSLFIETESGDLDATFSVDMEDYQHYYDDCPATSHVECCLHVMERHFMQEVLPLLSE